MVIAMRILASIFGMILLLPIALVLVALIMITLVGGYVGIVVTLLGDILWIIGGIIALIVVVTIVIKFLNR